GELMAHDVPLGCAPDEYDDLISGTCSHLPYSVLVIYLYALFNCGRSPIKNWRFFNAGILNIYDKMELFIKKGI
ncbi:hypothetical protein, partial [Klebsiella pneumoniae]